jgi:hypothetical protein
MFGDYKKHQGARVYGLKIGDNDEDKANKAGFDHHYLYDKDGRGKPVPNKVNPRPYGSKA